MLLDQLESFKEGLREIEQHQEGSDYKMEE